MSARLSMATPQRPTSPSAIGSSESMPEQRRHVERRRQAVTAGLDDLLEPPVGVVGGAEAGEHPHRPQLRAVHRRVRAPRVRVDPGELAVVGAVHRLERHARHRGERRVAQLRRLEGGLPLLAGAHWRRSLVGRPSKSRMSAGSRHCYMSWTSRLTRGRRRGGDVADLGATRRSTAFTVAASAFVEHRRGRTGSC